jgi:hypothetical protein
MSIYVNVQRLWTNPAVANMSIYVNVQRLWTNPAVANMSIYVDVQSSALVIDFA